MCGICGHIGFSGNADRRLVEGMVRRLRHRGPDELGLYTHPKAILGHSRLSIIDLSAGRQPIHNEDKSVWITFNGEIFNYVELRRELMDAGHRFYTKTDTEVLIHLYEEHGPGLFSRINGQFSFVIWDAAKNRVLAARDRMGVRPFFYRKRSDGFLFASEIKAFCADPDLNLEIDPDGLDQLFTGWATLPPTTVFKDIFELPPAHYLIADSASFDIRRYWDIPFEPEDSPVRPFRSVDEHAEAFHALLLDSIKLRLRADVPVASYLSGGLDSSLITAMIKRHFNADLRTFSLTFTDKAFDESRFQEQMVALTGTLHHEIRCGHADIGRALPETVWAAEKPLIRTASAPMLLLSGLVRDNGIKVVLTGEGADEIMGGYDLFKEMKVRRFWARNPASTCRPALFKRIYRDGGLGTNRVPAFIEAYYRRHLGHTASRTFSHKPRFETTSFIKTFYSADFKARLRPDLYEASLSASFPDAFDAWGPLSKAQYVEMATLLSGNLLSSQGDRMAMAHGIEGRYPFLDYRLVELAARIPEHLRMNGLTEKYLQKRIAVRYLPEAIVKRPKQAYRSPESASLFALPEIDDLLSRQNLEASGYFDPGSVQSLAAKCRNAGKIPVSNRHEIALTGIVTLLLLHRQYVEKDNQRFVDADTPHIFDMNDS